jgi:hypothetical protein
MRRKLFFSTLISFALLKNCFAQDLLCSRLALLKTCFAQDLLCSRLALLKTCFAQAAHGTFKKSCFA